MNQVASFMLVPCLAYFLTLMMEATCSSDMSADFQQATQGYIPADRTLHNLCCKNRKLISTGKDMERSGCGLFQGTISALSIGIEENYENIAQCLKVKSF
jgi:hypothetical protein